MLRIGKGKVVGLREKLETSCVAAIFLFHVLYVTGFYETVGIFLNSVRIRAISFGLIAFLAIITRPAFKSTILEVYHRLFFIAIALVTSGYLVFCYQLFEYRIGSAMGYEIVLGIIAIILVLEVTRLTVGKGMPILVIVFIFYTLFGNYIPGFLGAPPATLRLVSGQSYIGLMGIYGIPLGVIVDYIFSFLLFGYVLNVTGGIDFFVRITIKAFGKMRGAGAKAAVVTNFFIGMIQGSSVAAVLLSGPFTIPRMRDDGYSEAYMGGMIGTAANAAQLMPPVMGIVAFVMANLLNMPYVMLCVAAFIPGTLYYLALLLNADMEAARKHILPPSSSPESAIPLKELVVKNLHCLAGFILLIVLLASQVLTVKLSVALTSIAVLALSFLRKETRPSFKDLLNIPRWIGKDLVAIAPVCAAAGIVIACVAMTSLDYRFAIKFSELAGANLLVILLFAGILCFILGMALPTLPAYIVVALLVAPPLTKLGIAPIVVHMFVFYMALTAMVTPPVCLNIYAVSPMVTSSIWSMGLQAIRIGGLVYIIPFMFVYNPALLMEGSVGEIVWAIFSGLLLVLGFCFATNRYALTDAHPLEILGALAGGFLIYFPIAGLPLSPRIIGGILMTIVSASQVLRWLKAR